MTEVIVRGLGKQYGGKPALRSLDLTVKSGEFLTLLGPSGCGKTTTLRSLAGLERPSAGTISFGDRVVVDAERGLFVPPDRRGVGMVFQSYALWPQMTVAENVVYPLKVARVPARERRERVQSILDAVGLGEFHARPVTALSGGQQQRVALARALVARPDVVFYDEPLSNLDTKLRYRMAQQVRSLHDQFETTSVYVTHDQEEAITLSDRIVIMNHGTIEQQGTPQELYDHPATAYVADFMGFQNILPGSVVAAADGSADVRIGGSELVVRVAAERLPAIGAEVEIAFRAGNIQLRDGAGSDPRVIEATVIRPTFVGSAYNLLVSAKGAELRIRVERGDLDRLGLGAPTAGDPIAFVVGSHRAVLLERPADERAPYATEALPVLGRSGEEAA